MVTADKTKNVAISHHLILFFNFIQFPKEFLHLDYICVYFHFGAGEVLHTSIEIIFQSRWMY